MPAETTAVEASKAPRRWALPEFNASDWDILVLSTALAMICRGVVAAEKCHVNDLFAIALTVLHIVS